MWGYLWIPILFSLSKEFSSVEAQSKILLPSQRQQQQNDAVSSLSVLGPRCPVPDSKLNYRPVIGIVTHPGDGASGRLNNATNASYIAASYVKFVESAGARVIPLIYNEPEDVLFEVILKKINSILFFMFICCYCSADVVVMLIEEAGIGKWCTVHWRLGQRWFVL